MLMDDQGLILIRDSAMGCYGHRNVCVCVCAADPHLPYLSFIFGSFTQKLMLNRFNYKLYKALKKSGTAAAQKYLFLIYVCRFSLLSSCG